MITEQPNQNLVPLHKQGPLPDAGMGILEQQQLELPLEETPE